MSEQLPLALRFPADQRLDGFFGAEGVCEWIRRAALGTSSEALYLSGPAASGKTHLLLAACAEAEAAGRCAVFMPLAALAGRLPQALEGQGDADLLCLDGLEALAGHAEDQIAVFHCHNRARAAGGAVIYAAREIPAALGLSLPDLLSRLGQCTRLALQPLADDERRSVLQQRAQRRGLELDEVVLDYLFRRVGRDLASLSRLLDRLDRESLAAQRRITVPFLRKILAG